MTLCLLRSYSVTQEYSYNQYNQAIIKIKSSYNQNGLLKIAQCGPGLRVYLSILGYLVGSSQNLLQIHLYDIQVGVIQCLCHQFILVQTDLSH